MKDIDFLPARYRERSAQRRARIWRGLMLVCLAGFVGVIALAQLAMRRPIDRQLTAISIQYPAAVVAAAQADQLQKDLVEIEQFAELYTYLRHPWPVTQLLAKLTEPLPDSIVLTEITFDRKPGQNVAPPPAGQPNTPAASAAEAAKRDLDRLRSSQDSVVGTLHVIGMTTDPSNLHGYVSRLAPSTLFKSARIESLEAVTSEAGISGSRFELQLQLRPAFGQPDGPKEPILESTPLATARWSPSQ